MNLLMGAYLKCPFLHILDNMDVCFEIVLRVLSTAKIIIFYIFPLNLRLIFDELYEFSQMSSFITMHGCNIKLGVATGPAKRSVLYLFQLVDTVN